MKIINYQNIFLTRSGIGLKHFKLVEETIHQYKGKRKHFLQYALYQFFFKRKIRLKGKYFVIHNHWCPGYYHWITEALPRMLRTESLVGDRVLVLPESFKEGLYDSLQPLYSGPVFWIPQNKNLRIENLLVPENPPFSGQYDANIFFQLREKYLMSLNQMNLGVSTNRKIYISRSKANRRKVVNEKEITDALIGQGFSIVNFEDYTFWQQVLLMSCAELVVSIHGAGLTNLLFMKENGGVIELQKKPNQSEEVDVLYKDLANVMKLNYKVLMCESALANESIYTADIVVNLNQLLNLITF